MDNGTGNDDGGLMGQHDDHHHDHGEQSRERPAEKQHSGQELVPMVVPPYNAEDKYPGFVPLRPGTKNQLRFFNNDDDYCRYRGICMRLDLEQLGVVSAFRRNVTAYRDKKYQYPRYLHTSSTASHCSSSDLMDLYQKWLTQQSHVIRNACQAALDAIAATHACSKAVGKAADYTTSPSAAARATTSAGTLVARAADMARTAQDVQLRAELDPVRGVTDAEARTVAEAVRFAMRAAAEATAVAQVVGPGPQRAGAASASTTMPQHAGPRPQAATALPQQAGSGPQAATVMPQQAGTAQKAAPVMPQQAGQATSPSTPPSHAVATAAASGASQSTVAGRTRSATAGTIQPVARHSATKRRASDPNREPGQQRRRTGGTSVGPPGQQPHPLPVQAAVPETPPALPVTTPHTPQVVPLGPQAPLDPLASLRLAADRYRAAMQTCTTSRAALDACLAKLDAALPALLSEEASAMLSDDSAEVTSLRLCDRTTLRNAWVAAMHSAAASRQALGQAAAVVAAALDAPRPEANALWTEATALDEISRALDGYEQVSALCAQAEGQIKAELQCAHEACVVAFDRSRSLYDVGATQKDVAEAFCTCSDAQGQEERLKAKLLAALEPRGRAKDLLGRVLWQVVATFGG